jgi:hypothetical protein
VLKDEFEDGDGVRDDLKLVVIAGMMITIPHPPYLIYHPKVLPLTLGRSSVSRRGHRDGQTGLVYEIQEGKGRMVSTDREGGG